MQTYLFDVPTLIIPLGVFSVTNNINFCDGNLDNPFMLSNVCCKLCIVPCNYSVCCYHGKLICSQMKRVIVASPVLTRYILLQCETT